MKLHSLLLVSALIVSAAFSCSNKAEDPVPPTDNDQDESALVNAGWTKVFDEDFNSDFSKWNIWYGGAYNEELQCYTKDSANIKIRNGVLNITALKQNVTGPSNNGAVGTQAFGYTSGRIESKTTVSANTTTPSVRISARIKLPAGYGMWPAFWSYGNSWPQNGEIDIFEARGNEPTIYATNYFYGTEPKINLVSGAEKVLRAPSSLVQYWHVYEVVWDKTALTFYLDGKVVDTKAASSVSGQYVDDMFGKVQNIVLNVGVGGNYFSNLQLDKIQTGTMYVDWVKVYNKNN